MDMMSVSHVADNLQVSAQRVRNMIAHGQLAGEQINGRWFIDPASIQSVKRRAGQPMSERVAWGLVELASGGNPINLSDSERSRLRSRWRSMLHSADPVQAISSALARRASRSRWSSPDLEGVRADPRFVPSGISDHRAGISVESLAEGYVLDAEFDDFVADHLLVPARGAESVILHRAPVQVKEPVPWLLVAADLAEGDARRAQQANQLIQEHRAHV